MYFKFKLQNDVLLTYMTNFVLLLKILRNAKEKFITFILFCNRPFYMTTKEHVWKVYFLSALRYFNVFTLLPLKFKHLLRFFFMNVVNGLVIVQMLSYCSYYSCTFCSQPLVFMTMLQGLYIRNAVEKGLVAC